MTDETPAYKLYADKYFATRADLDVQLKAMCAAVAESINKATNPLHERILELEREVRSLKGIAPDREEWPLRVVGGGKR